MKLSNSHDQVLTGRRGSMAGGMDQSMLDKHSSYNPDDFRASFSQGSESKGAKAWLYPELPWGAPPNWDSKTHRGKTFLRFWDMVTFLACMYVAIAVPYFAGFEDARWVPGQETCTFLDLDADWKIATAVMDVTVDCVFFLDIVFGFHTARWEIDKKGRPHWKLIDDLPIVRKAYLKGNFALDALGQIPWQYVDCFTTNVSTFTKMLRLLRLIKLFRLYRLRRMIEGLYFKYPRSVFAITGIELLGTMALMGHWLCCIWFRIGTASESGWTLAQGIEDEDGSIIGGQPYYEWITSFYWAITTMTTIGYGDISASTAEERTLAIFVMVLGCAFFAWGTGRITQLLTEQSSCDARFKDKMEELQAYMLSNDMPTKLQERIMSYYMLKFPTMKIFEEEDILNDLPIGLRRSVVWVIFEDILGTQEDGEGSDGITLFQTCDKVVKEDIGTRMKRGRFYKSATLDITAAGEFPDGLYIVRFGAVDIYVKGEKEPVKTLTRGDIFGENAILGLTSSGLRNRSAVSSPLHAFRDQKARTICELCFLSREDFLEVMTIHPSFRQRIRDLVNMHLRNLSRMLSRKQTPTVKDRYCIDWDAVAQEISAQEGYVKQARTMEERHNALRTTVSLTMRNFHLVPPLPPSFESQYAFLAVSWPGYPCAAGKIPNLHFSRIFQLHRADTEELKNISFNVTMTLLSDFSDWENMPPITISLHSHTHMNIMRSVSALGEYVSLQQWMQKNPNCKMLAKTVIPLKPLIKSRISTGKIQITWVQAAAALRAASYGNQQRAQNLLQREQSTEQRKRGMSISLTVLEEAGGSNGDAGDGVSQSTAHGCVNLELRAVVSRQLSKDSPWRKVVWNSQHAQGLSADFLVRKYEQELERKKKGLDAVFLAITKQRAKEMRDVNNGGETIPEADTDTQVQTLRDQVRELELSLLKEHKEAKESRAALEQQLMEQRQEVARNHAEVQAALIQLKRLIVSNSGGEGRVDGRASPADVHVGVTREAATGRTSSAGAVHPLATDETVLDSSLLLQGAVEVWA